MWNQRQSQQLSATWACTAWCLTVHSIGLDSQRKWAIHFRTANFHHVKDSCCPFRERIVDWHLTWTTCTNIACVRNVNFRREKNVNYRFFSCHTHLLLLSSWDRPCLLEIPLVLLRSLMQCLTKQTKWVSKSLLRAEWNFSKVSDSLSRADRVSKICSWFLKNSFYVDNLLEKKTVA